MARSPYGSRPTDSPVFARAPAFSRRPGYLAAIATRLLNYIQLPKLPCTRAFGSGGERSSLRATCAPRAVSPSLSRQFRKVCQRANRCDSASFSRYLRIHVVLATEITEIKGRRIAPWLTKAASIRSAANIGLLLSTLGWKIEKKKAAHPLSPTAMESFNVSNKKLLLLFYFGVNNNEAYGYNGVLYLYLLTMCVVFLKRTQLARANSIVQIHNR